MKSLRFIPIHQIAGNLGPDKYFEFLFFKCLVAATRHHHCQGKARYLWMRLLHYLQKLLLLQHRTKSVVVTT